MKYGVIWLEAALAQLARSYVPLWGTPQGAEVTAAMARIDLRLEANAPNEGESRAGLVRLLIEGPLWVEFEVHEAHRVAIVTTVGYHPPRPR